MQATQDGVFPGKSEVFFLPMIDLSPNDVTCIYSTLVFICDQAKRHSVTPVITFDQPLYIKAQAIISSEGPDSIIKSVVLQLGNFHTQMSFLGSMGHLMSGSGLQEAFELVYAPAAVPYILNGKAYSRAVRAHLLMDAALNAILTAGAFDMPWILVHHDEVITNELMDTKSEENESVIEIQNLDAVEDNLDINNTESNVVTSLTATQALGNEDLDSAASLIDQLLAGQISAQQAARDPVVERIAKTLAAHKSSLSNSRTSRLWLLYLEMIDILKMTIKAERTGNFSLHLQAVASMLPFFAASGHHHYAKSARLYLQQMMELKDSNPSVYQSFEAGHNVFRRSDRFWAGLSKDLMIEQVLMKSLKTSGGLTRGTGLKENQRTLWLLSMPVCAQVSAAMQSLTGVSSSSCDRHKESTEARMKRDHTDTNVLLSFLLTRNPFTPMSTLLNIANGRTADPEVNVDSAKEIGQNIMQSMTGKSVLDARIQKKDVVVTLATKHTVKVREEPVNVDPLLLFQRLLTVAKSSSENLSSFFQYELTNVPTSLFDSSGLPRESKKSSLADYIWSLLPEDVQNSHFPQDPVHFVLDGGSLMSKLPWQRGSTYNELTEAYTELVARKYRKATIVFDGYNSKCTIKDATHLRRHGHQGIEVCFSGDMTLQDSKDTFLANKQNKQRFINLLSDALSRNGFQTIHAADDADCQIVQQTLTKAKTGTAVLVGEDTDLLVLLLHHTNHEHGDIFFVPGKVSGVKKAKIWDIKKVQQVLGSDMCDGILFVHAISGCDTTSRMFSVGKNQSLKKLSSTHFRQQADVFMKTGSTHDEIAEAGEKAIVSLYSGNKSDSLDELRFVKYMQKIATSTKSPQPNNLPPTSSAKYHSFRTYFQVQVWANMDESIVKLDPREWGWEKQQGLLLPVYTDKAVAPDELLHIVRCSCKAACATAACSCRKHGLVCSVGCNHCRGETCSNSVNFIDVELSDSEPEC